MKPVQFQIKWLTLLTIPGLGPAQAAPQQDLLHRDTRRLGIDEMLNLKEAYGGKVVLVERCLSSSAPQSPQVVNAVEALL
ncbi:MAG: hypothetical protein WBM59_07935 [Sedimenticolaceae bacterium]|jgi:hypothetical protein